MAGTWNIVKNSFVGGWTDWHDFVAPEDEWWEIEDFWMDSGDFEVSLKFKND